MYYFTLLFQLHAEYKDTLEALWLTTNMSAHRALPIEKAKKPKKPFTIEKFVHFLSKKLERSDFDGWSEQDAHEFFTVFITNLNMDVAEQYPTFNVVETITEDDIRSV